MSSILMSILLYKAVILLGEIRCWSLLGLKRLNIQVVPGVDLEGVGGFLDVLEPLSLPQILPLHLL